MEESGSISVQSEQKGATEFSPACPKGLSRRGRRKERQIMNKRQKKKLFRKKDRYKSSELVKLQSTGFPQSDRMGVDGIWPLCGAM